RISALAWWTDAAGRRHVRVFARVCRGGPELPPSWGPVFGGIPQDAPGFRFVYGDVWAVVEKVAGARYLDQVPAQFRRAIEVAGGAGQWPDDFAWRANARRRPRGTSVSDVLQGMRERGEAGWLNNWGAAEVDGEERLDQWGAAEVDGEECLVSGRSHWTAADK